MHTGNFHRRGYLILHHLAGYHSGCKLSQLYLPSFSKDQVRIQGGGAGGPDPPGKSQVICVSIGNKQLNSLEKVGPPWKKLDPLENVEPPLEP